MLVNKTVLINVLVFLLLSFLKLFPFSENLISLMIYLSLSYSLLFCVFLIKRIGMFHLLTLFNIIFSFFYLSKGLLHIFDMYPYEEAFKFRHILMNGETQKSMIFYPICSLLFTNCAFFLTNKKEILNIKSNILSNFQKFRQQTIIIFLITYPFTLYKSIKRVFFVINNGYLSLYNGALDSLKFNFVFNLSTYFTEFAYAAFVATSPTKKQFLRISLLFLFFKLFDLLTGRRNQFVVTFLFILWYYNKYFTKIKIRVTHTAIIILLLLASFLVRDFENLDLIDNESLAILFLTPITNSHLILGYIMEFGYEKIINLPGLTLLAPFQLIRFDGQSYAFLQDTWGLGHHLTFFLNPDSYYNGEGIGSSFIAELYSLGLFGILFGSFIIGWLIQVMSRKRMNSVTLILTYFIITHLLFMSRSSFFIPIFKPLFYCMFFLPIIYFIKISLWKKNSH